MNEEGFSRAVSVLSGEHSLSILRYLSTSEWRIASDVSRALKIHTTTASKFLTAMYDLGFLERRLRKARTRGAFEYRMGSNRLTLELEFAPSPQPLKEALDYYLDYVGRVLDKARRLGWPAVQERFEARLETNRNGLKQHLFTRILDGGGARGMDELKTLFSEIHREFYEIAAETLGKATARRILDGAAEEAERGREALVRRYDLRGVLGV